MEIPMPNLKGRPVAAVRETPLVEAAQATLAAGLMRIPRFVAAAVARGGSLADRDEARSIHKLRVACRRVESVFAAYADLLPERRLKKTRKWLRVVRRAAGKSRDVDVVVGRLRRDARTLDSDSAHAARALARHLVKGKKKSGDELEAIAAKYPKARWAKAQRELVAGIDADPVIETTLGQLAQRVVRITADHVRAISRNDLAQIDNVHELRLAIKRLRYQVEVFAECVDPAEAQALREHLSQLQTCLGAVSDLSKICDECGQGNRADVQAQGSLIGLRDHYAHELSAAHRHALAAWKALESGKFFPLLSQAMGGAESGQTHRELGMDGIVEPKPTRFPNRPETRKHLNGSASRTGSHKPDRIAAIDVGTNSIRLIIAEASNDGSYRVLDDEKEITRLGRGLQSSGQMDPGAITHSVAAISRMKSIAEGYGVSSLRLVATAAPRLASNAHVLLNAVHQATGLHLEVIDAEQEAMLAYNSAANAFDLTSLPAIVVDIGGGSTEAILSVGINVAGGRPSQSVGPGVIERVYTLPIGVIGLTERFGLAERVTERRFKELRTYVKSIVRDHFGKGGVPIVPQIMVGTGGTFTTLAAMARMHVLGERADGLLSRSVQGFEVTRAETRHLLDYLRKLSARERTRVPGLPGDRADIILAGLVIVDVLLKTVGANKFRAHDGGIRDGILLEMVRSGAAVSGSETKGQADRPDPVRSARKFASACGFEQSHALHVAQLSLNIFDHLLPCFAEELHAADIDAARARQVLEAAAILHDVGYLINYNAHHKHSYHLISHADLAGWTSTEVQVIANIARYHRRASPSQKHRPFAALAQPHQHLVRILAGILRIADGLDRTHMQVVSSLTIKLKGKEAYMSVTALEEPSVDMWGAMRKGELLTKAIDVNVHIEWKCSSSESRLRSKRYAAAV